jgi:MFS family permease
LTLYFQDAPGYTPLQASLLFVPMTAASVVASPFARRLTSRLGDKWTAAWGFAITAAGLILVASCLSSEGGLVAMLFGMVVAEAGFMIANVPLTIAATGNVGEDKRGLASGILSTSTEVGNALGWAAVAAVIAAVAESGPGGEGALFSGLRWGLWSAATFAALALVLVILFMRSGVTGHKRRLHAP